MKQFRSLRFENVIQQQLSQLILEEFDFDGALVTIREVIVEKDLKQARVKLSVIPFEKELASFIMVDSRKKELQGKLLRKLNVRPMPQLKFEIERP